MATRLDDALIHQNYGTLDNVVEPDLRWFDRYYFNFHAIDGSFAMSHGLGVYPNTKVMDGFSIVATPELQVNVRASRELIKGDRDRMDIGPIHAEILDPMRRWHFRLDENEYGISYDFTYHAKFEALEPLRLVSHVEGRRVWDWTHYTHVGSVEGWAKIDGRVVNLKTDTHWALRDRSWGVRPGVGKIEENDVQLSQAKWGTRHNWVCLQLESFYLWYFLTEEEDGTQRFFEGLVRWSEAKGGAQEKVTHIVRRFDTGSQQYFQSAELDVHLESGRVLPIRIKRLSTTVHIRGAGYGGLKGVTHGMPQGPLLVTGERWSPVDSRVNPDSLGLQDHIVDVDWGNEHGYGLFELSYGT